MGVLHVLTALPFQVLRAFPPCERSECDRSPGPSEPFERSRLDEPSDRS